MCKNTCNKCNLEKDCSEFHKMKKMPKGVRNVCKNCRKIERKEYRQRPGVIEKSKLYYQENKVAFRERMKKHYHSLNGQYHQYKKRAKKSNLVFELTENDCKQFYRTDCVYCNDTIKDLGIDRVDNNKGYTLNNCVPCCSTCNFMKNVNSTEQFIEHIKKIYKNFIK